MAEKHNTPGVLLETENALLALAFLPTDDIYDINLQHHIIPELFTDYRNQRIWESIQRILAEGERPTWLRVQQEAEVSYQYLSENILSGHSSKITERDINALWQAKAVRDMQEKLKATLAELHAGYNPYEIIDNLQRFLPNLGSPDVSQQAITLEEMIETADAFSPWVIPGLLKTDWRAIIVGREGLGKGTVLRAIGMCAAQGIHPFTYRDIEPQRVLLYDLENPKEAIVETGVILQSTLMSHAKDYQEERFKIFHKPSGVDLRKRRDRATLEREIAFHKPSLLLIGPLYKMSRTGGNEGWDERAEQVQELIDDLRTKYNFAVVIEAHMSKDGEDPRGSQLWMGWPEIGIRLEAKDGDKTNLKVEKFRGDRLRCNWPIEIKRDKTWLWDPRYDMPMDRLG